MADAVTPCQFGYTEYDGSKYCHEHCGILHAGSPIGARCDTSWQDIHRDQSRIAP